MAEERKLHAGSTPTTARALVILTSIVFAAMLCLAGCSQGSSASKEPEANYTVVSVDKGTNPNDYFSFTSVDHSSVSTAAAPNSNIKEGVYSIGRLKDGNTVVWLSSDDTTGYDDCLFVYVEDELTNVSAVSWAEKLNETAIPYEEFEKSL